jgi:hypothetical protein
MSGKRPFIALSAAILLGSALPALAGMDHDMGGHERESEAPRNNPQTIAPLPKPKHPSSHRHSPRTPTAAKAVHSQALKPLPADAA